jgi:hypothetical protein
MMRILPRGAARVLTDLRCRLQLSPILPISGKYSPIFVKNPESSRAKSGGLFNEHDNCESSYCERGRSEGCQFSLPTPGLTRASEPLKL